MTIRGCHKPQEHMPQAIVHALNKTKDECTVDSLSTVHPLSLSLSHANVMYDIIICNMRDYSLGLFPNNIFISQAIHN